MTLINPNAYRMPAEGVPYVPEDDEDQYLADGGDEEANSLAPASVAPEAGPTSSNPADFQAKVDKIARAFIDRPGGPPESVSCPVPQPGDLQRKLLDALMKVELQANPASRPLAATAQPPFCLGPQASFADYALLPPGPKLPSLISADRDGNALYANSIPGAEYDNWDLQGPSPDQHTLRAQTPSGILFAGGRKFYRTGTGDDGVGVFEDASPVIANRGGITGDIEALAAGLKMGDRGEKVAKLQQALGVKADGVWDRETQAALNGYRAASGDPGALGLASEIEESGGKSVDSISPGTGDPGGRSYGAHQLATIPGTMAAFVKSPENQKYAAAFAGSTPGTPQFNEAYRGVVRDDRDGFAKAQLDFLNRTHFQPTLKRATELGFDVSDPGVREALFSQAIQHGGSQKILVAAVASNPGIGTLPPEKQIEALYTARGNYAPQHRGRYAREMPLMQNVSKYYRTYFKGSE